MWTMEPRVLTLEERSELERRVRARTTPHRDRQHAQVVLLALDGVTGRQIAKHPRFVVLHTPAHASWLNQSNVSSILIHKLLRRSEFSSREDLVMKMLSFIEHHSERAKPFKWFYDAKVAA